MGLYLLSSILVLGLLCMEMLYMMGLCSVYCGNIVWAYAWFTLEMLLEHAIFIQFNVIIHLCYE